MHYFDATGILRPKYAKPLKDMGWHAFGDHTSELSREYFATLNAESVSVLEFEGEDFVDVGNPQRKVILVEVGHSAHSVWDCGRDYAERVAELIKGIIQESRRTASATPHVGT
jgi:hypothetical protein